jgi:hypothetical protein
MIYYTINYKIVDLTHIENLFIEGDDYIEADYLMYHTFSEFIHKQNYSIQKDFEITHNYNLMSYVCIEKIDCGNDELGEEELEEFENDTNIVMKYYPSIFKSNSELNNLFKQQDRVIIAYMITRPIYNDIDVFYGKPDNFFKNKNYDIISYMDVIYKNKFNYEILNNMMNKYISINNKQLVQLSEIEKPYVKFWIDRLKLKTIDDFDNWFYSMFKSQEDDLKYEFDECMTYEYYKNIIEYLK